MQPTGMKRLLMACGLLMATATLAHANTPLTANDSGLVIENGTLTRVDRNRSYGTLRLDGVSQLRTDDGEKITVVEKGKEESKNVHLFQYVQVRHIVFPEAITSADSRSFTGVKDLEVLEFEGAFPDFKEEHSWFAFGEEDWRKTLKRVIVWKDPDLRKLVFAGAVQCLEIKDTPEMRKRLMGEDVKRFFSTCSNLRQLIVPYSLAKEPRFPFAEMFQASGLNDKEVLSEPDPATGDVVLLNVAKNGVISEGVTQIRGDAVRFFENDRITLPTTIKGFVQVEAKDTLFGKSFFLKDETVCFFPEIDNPGKNKMPQKDVVGSAANVVGRSLFPSFKSLATLSISTAYERLRPEPEEMGKGKTYEEWEGLKPEKSGQSYQLKVPFEMNKTYCLRLALDLEELASPLPVFWKSSMTNTKNYKDKRGGEVFFSTPARRAWFGTAVFWMALGLSLIHI